MFAAVPHMPADGSGEQVNLSAVLKNNVTEIFTRVYAEPRSEYCSSGVRRQSAGWMGESRWAGVRSTMRGAGCGRVAEDRRRCGLCYAGGSTPNCLFLSHWRQDERAMEDSPERAGRMASIC